MSAYFAGFALAFSLILAIGAQNAFVLRQGLRNEHVLAVVLACALSDAVLITLGVSGFGAISELAPWLIPAFKYGGAAFLLAYGALSFRAAWRGGAALNAGDQPRQSLTAALTTCLALTWLNPHVYLDTVVLLGSISTQYEGARLEFGLGAVSASFTFFFCLGFGARLLRGFFARPAAWRALDLVVGLTMWAISASLIVN